MHHDAMSNDADSKWQVMVAPGDVRTWDLDQLDAAYKSGLIDENVRLCEVGGRDWMTLGELLGDDDAAGAHEPVPASTAPVTYTPMAPPTAIPSSQLAFAPPSAPPSSLAPAAMSVRPSAPATAYDERPAPPRRDGGSRVAQGVFALACAAVVAVGGLSGAKLATMQKGPITVSGAAVQALSAPGHDRSGPAEGAGELPRAAEAQPIAPAHSPEAAVEPKLQPSTEAPPAYVPGRHVAHETKKATKAAPAKRAPAKGKKAAKSASTGANDGVGRFDPLNGEL